MHTIGSFHLSDLVILVVLFREPERHINKVITSRRRLNEKIEHSVQLSKEIFPDQLAQGIGLGDNLPKTCHSEPKSLTKRFLIKILPFIIIDMKQNHKDHD